MFGVSRVSSTWGLGADWLGELLLNLSFLRLGIVRSSGVEDLPDHLRRDIGLPPRQRLLDPSDLRR